MRAKYIEIVFNWRRASDERGVSSLQRSKYNYNFLNIILDELMPWHKESYDFALLEVNRLSVLLYLHTTITLYILGVCQIYWVFQGRLWLP